MSWFEIGRITQQWRCWRALINNGNDDSCERFVMSWLCERFISMILCKRFALSWMCERFLLQWLCTRFVDPHDFAGKILKMPENLEWMLSKWRTFFSSLAACLILSNNETIYITVFHETSFWRTWKSGSHAIGFKYNWQKVCLVKDSDINEKSGLYGVLTKI